MDDSQRKTKGKSVPSFEHSLWVTSKSLETHSFRLMLIHISPIINANEIFSLTEIKKPYCKYLMIVSFLFSIVILCFCLPCVCFTCYEIVNVSHFSGKMTNWQDFKIETDIDFSLQRKWELFENVPPEQESLSVGGIPPTSKKMIIKIIDFILQSRLQQNVVIKGWNELRRKLCITIWRALVDFVYSGKIRVRPVHFFDSFLQHEI